MPRVTASSVSPMLAGSAAPTESRNEPTDVPTSYTSPTTN